MWLCSSGEEEEPAELPSSTDKFYLGEKSIGCRRTEVIGTICCSKPFLNWALMYYSAETWNCPHSSLSSFVCSVMASSSLGLGESKNLGCSLSWRQWLGWRNQSELGWWGWGANNAWRISIKQLGKGQEGWEKEFPSVLREALPFQGLCGVD